MGVVGAARWRAIAGAVVLLAASWVPATSAAATQLRDGPAPCTAGPPPYPLAGFCGTYHGANTFFGTYGPGFPTATGWGLCAFLAGGGGSYPAPGYDYVLSGPPAGADTSQLGPLGYAFSRGLVEGTFGGVPGQFTADQAAVAAKLLYDDTVWHPGPSSLDPGVQTAYTTFLGWALSAVGASGPPTLRIGLVGGGSTFTSNAQIQTTAAFPGTGRGVAGLTVLVGLTNATFDGTAGATSAVGTTDAAGVLIQRITATGHGPVTVTVTAIANVGQLGLSFFRPTRHVLGAQDIVAPEAPTTIIGTASFTSSGPPPPAPGAIALLKSGDDTSYFSVAGAVFDVLRGSAVVASLVVGEDGAAGPTGPLEPGTYTVREVTPPPGYQPAPDQVVTVVGGQTVTASFTGPAGDRIERASLRLKKVDAATGEPLAGAVLGVSYDSQNSGGYDVDLGTCTTSLDGLCALHSDLLPGRYKVVEVAPPPGHVADPSSPVFLELSPGQTGSVVLHDPALVAQSFHKVAVGNVDPDTVILAGATVTVVTRGGAVVTSCTTDHSGSCTVAAVLVEGERYCWHETAAPPGLQGGGHGCFTATADGPSLPIVIEDPGRYVEIQARKVDATDPAIGLAGATFDLYRMDGGTGPTKPTPPANAAALSGGTWVARATSAPGGDAQFPLQLPDFAYCVLEHSAPPGYELSTAPVCTQVLEGVTTVPPTTADVVSHDVPTVRTLHVAKTNAVEPSAGVPGATYDLYVKDPAPPGTPTPPSDAPSHPGLTWYARGTTSSTGHLSFTIPVGYAWCVAELTSPPGFVLDTGLHCTAPIDADTPDPVTHLAIVEQPEEIVLSAFKFTASAPGIGIPGASYALFVQGAFPVGYQAPQVPPGLAVPAGSELFAIGTTDGAGRLSFPIPVGHAWCLEELAAPPGYVIDPGLHCTAVLDAATAPSGLEIGLVELAFTGALLPVGPGIACLGIGVTLLVLARTRRRRRRGGMI